MANASILYRLLSCLSPVFPTGAFAYSSGLEGAFAAGAIKEPEDLTRWLADLMAYGYLRNDAIITAYAWENAHHQTALLEADDAAKAMAPSSTRFREQIALGTSFLGAAREWDRSLGAMLPPSPTLPVAVGAVCSDLHIPKTDAVTGFLQSSLSNLVQVSLRLAPIGQKAGVRILAALESEVEALSTHVEGTDLTSLSSMSYLADIHAMSHNILPARIFQS